MKGKKALSPVERTRQHREKLQEKGYKQINVWLTPEAQLAMSETIRRLSDRGVKLNQSQVICDALMRDLK